MITAFGVLIFSPDERCGLYHWILVQCRQLYSILMFRRVYVARWIKVRRN
jgi:hypothetical protein